MSGCSTMHWLILMTNIYCVLREWSAIWEIPVFIAGWPKPSRGGGDHIAQGSSSCSLVQNAKKALQSFSPGVSSSRLNSTVDNRWVWNANVLRFFFHTSLVFVYWTRNKVRQPVTVVYQASTQFVNNNTSIELQPKSRNSRHLRFTRQPPALSFFLSPLK